MLPRLSKSEPTAPQQGAQPRPRPEPVNSYNSLPHLEGSSGEPIKVTVEETLRDKCAFWVGFAAAAITIATFPITVFQSLR
jgi:hypothetical protein